jgi:hypothetical protein
MDYELYHDESKQGGYWHGMLLVPTDTKNALLDLLAISRENANYKKPVGIKKVNNAGKKSDCVEAWIHLGVAATISRPEKARLEGFIGKVVAGRRIYEFTDTYIGAKFVLFRDVDGHSSMNGHVDHGSKVETTMRMGLKGGLHLLGQVDHPVNVIRLHFDGWEHHQRHISAERIVGRMHGLRPYCTVAEEIDDRPSNHERAGCQNYGDCQLLQLTDVLIGAFRSAYGVCTNEHQVRFATIVKPIVERHRQGPARMRNSRWRGGFAMSQCQLVDGNWSFGEIEGTQIGNQAELF